MRHLSNDKNYKFDAIVVCIDFRSQELFQKFSIYSKEDGLTYTKTFLHTSTEELNFE
jgi:hypothetical protein